MSLVVWQLINTKTYAKLVGVESYKHNKRFYEKSGDRSVETLKKWGQLTWIGEDRLQCTKQDIKRTSAFKRKFVKHKKHKTIQNMQIPIAIQMGETKAVEEIQMKLNNNKYDK
ncbi:hypothetical protein HELRODRAFT_178712 [Helobdella robusta]|uniref:Uncharacterized protein n=1 Tax=Helobdella robusta TaxID=6412 RepID=T1FDL9_HELRO|nr:hypothetical protein HELRODRAFT_178712 [Helobdella robusta]ESN96912.1 hypothetical protein HELRODRAFT_178712 [Helobdella robusta]